MKHAAHLLMEAAVCFNGREGGQTRASVDSRGFHARCRGSYQSRKELGYPATIHGGAAHLGRKQGILSRRGMLATFPEPLVKRTPEEA